MQFCPKCGAILSVKGKSAKCPRCNYSTKSKEKIKIVEKIDERKEIPIVSKKEGHTDPIVNEKCQKCKNEKAYFWTIQTRSGDEAETKFFRCTKCEFTWRSYR